MPVTFINSSRFGVPFDPLTLTWTRYFDYSDAASVTTSTGISQINDLSGNNGHATQGSGATQPAYTLAAKNGLNVGGFASAQYLLNSTTQAQPCMMFVVAKYTSGAGSQDLVTFGTSSALTFRKRNSGVWSLASTSELLSVTAVDTNWHVFCARFDGASSYLMMDGVTIASGDAGSTAAAPLNMTMGSNAALSRPFNGQLGQVAIGGAQSDTDRDAMVSHLRSKWAI